MVLKVCLHEWLSGGVSPCQGEGRGFESRLVLLMIRKEISDGYLFFCMFKPGRAERFESFCPTSRLLHSRYECLFSIIKERLCADVAELASINGVWLKCLSLGEQIRAYEKMFKNIASLSHTCYNFAIF